MAPTPSARARGIPESITLAIAARAKAMRADGIQVVSLGAGEPDFETPVPVADAGVAAIRDGHTRYTSAAGTPEVRAAGAEWLNRSFGLDYAPDQVMATAGAKPALTMALMALVDAGDRVLLPTPYWPSYPEMVRLVGGEPVELDPVPEQGFVHTGEQLALAAREHGAKGVMLNFPNNPSGAVPTAVQVEALVDAAIEHDLWILSDEIYARLIYDGLEHVSPARFAKARDRVLLVNGGTKSHSMTGWRIGFLAGPSELIAAAARLQSQAIGNPCSISQQAVIAVCEETDTAEFDRRHAAFDERRRYIVDAINAIDGLHLAMPQGAFYGLVDVREVCSRLGIADDVQFAERLLVDGLVATVPGTAFASPGFIRLSYAAAMDDLRLAVDRIQTFVTS